MLAELALSSWETMIRRGLMIARGSCSPSEYRRMVSEKAAAAFHSAAALAGGRNQAAAVIAPWHRRATGNAKRLRRRR